MSSEACVSAELLALAQTVGCFDRIKLGPFSVWKTGLGQYRVPGFTATTRTSGIWIRLQPAHIGFACGYSRVFAWQLISSGW